MKPPTGAACNGCGVCCLAEPRPVGMIVSLKRRGACRALAWSDADQRYRCGMMNASGWWRRWVVRLIAAGQGCDSDAELEAVEPGH